jgi:hypothetical protein
MEEVMKAIRTSLIGITALLGFATSACENKATPNDDPERMLSRDPMASPATPRDPAAPAARDPGPGGMEPAPGAAAANRSAVESITAARCDWEQRCNNVGSGKKYASRGQCVNRVHSDWQSDLNTLECPKGVVQAKLDRCLSTIRGEGCANPLESLGRLVACRQIEICRSSLSLAP